MGTRSDAIFLSVFEVSVEAFIDCVACTYRRAFASAISLPVAADDLCDGQAA